MKVVFGWLPQPIGGMSVIQQNFFDSFYQFVTYDTNNRKIFGGYTFCATGYIPSGRNTLVQTFLDRTEGDWLLMLDWDISFEPQQVYDLIDAADPKKRPIISGVYVTYFGEDSLLRPCWMAREGDEEYVPVSEFTPGKIIPLTVCGMGFTLMHRSALEKMEKAYKDDPWPWFGHDNVAGSRTGEDLTFCKRARDIGLTVWGHGGILLGHTKAKTLQAADMLNPNFARNEAPFGRSDASSELVAVPPKPGMMAVKRSSEKTILSVGAGGDATVPITYEGWEVATLDINPDTKPDIVADGRDLSGIKAASYDAVYCSHNLEHYPTHDVSKVLKGFWRILKPGGLVDIRTPDLGSVMKKVVTENLDLEDTLYESAAGPIAAKDIIYGFGKAIESGNDFYAHKSGFTRNSLKKVLEEVGFTKVVISSDGINMTAIGTKVAAAPKAKHEGVKASKARLKKA